MLVVEDDELTRMCLADVLADAGWRVTTAATAEQALHTPSAHPAPDVLVTDRLLGPGMTGPDLIKAARRRWPAVRAVLMSGADVCEPGLACGDQFLVKPFRAEILVRLLAELTQPALCSAEG